MIFYKYISTGLRTYYLTELPGDLTELIGVLRLHSWSWVIVMVTRLIYVGHCTDGAVISKDEAQTIYMNIDLYN